MTLFIPNFDETGHLNHEPPDYMDLVKMLQDCVNLLNEINVEDHLSETYINILINAQKMIHMHNNVYEEGHRIADNYLEENT